MMDPNDTVICMFDCSGLKFPYLKIKANPFLILEDSQLAEYYILKFKYDGIQDLDDVELVNFDEFGNYTQVFI